MFYYQAICRSHNFASNLFASRHSAVRSAIAHRTRVGGTHRMKILKVYIPTTSIQIKSEEEI